MALNYDIFGRRLVELRISPLFRFAERSRRADAESSDRSRTLVRVGDQGAQTRAHVIHRSPLLAVTHS